MHIVTNALIESVKTQRGAWTRRQLELLGVAWPPKKGWRHRSIGKVLTDEALAEMQAISAMSAAQESFDLSVMMGERIDENG